MDDSISDDDASNDVKLTETFYSDESSIEDKLSKKQKKRNQKKKRQHVQLQLDMKRVRSLEDSFENDDGADPAPHATYNYRDRYARAEEDSDWFHERARQNIEDGGTTERDMTEETHSARSTMDPELNPQAMLPHSPLLPGRKPDKSDKSFLSFDSLLPQLQALSRLGSPRAQPKPRTSYSASARDTTAARDIEGFRPSKSVFNYSKSAPQSPPT